METTAEVQPLLELHPYTVKEEEEEEEKVKQPQAQEQQQSSSSTTRRRRAAGIVTLQCPYCPRTITGDPSKSIRTNYNRHLLTHTKERPYKCEFCLADFTTSTNRRRHIIRLHPDMAALLPNPPRKKEMENENTEKDASNLQETNTPMNSNSNTVLICRFCAKDFTCKGSRTLHERHCPSRPQPARIIPAKSTHTNNTIINTNTNTINTSMDSNEKKEEEEEEEVQEPNILIPSAPGDTFVLCPNCEQELSGRAQLRRHLRCFCPFREDAFASPEREERRELSLERVGAPRTCTRRSRRILSRRRAGSDGHRRVHMRREGHEERWNREYTSTNTTTTTTNDNNNNNDSIHTNTRTTTTTGDGWGKKQQQQEEEGEKSTLRSGEIFLSAPPLLGERPMASSSPCGIGKWSLTTITTSTNSTTVICPYDDCMSTFSSRTRWLAHVARRHPKELQQATRVSSTSAVMTACAKQTL
ncbi:uncharacterized protein TM35_000022060 [Trypanosoma theileri]|uniref:C2H2-type domain-containing protein n=1 Tax=Trypanosoma theileri TaxID=67003 RepID=A0A1X0P8V1_9TRYP|nr:uncharacterized protein TM35_000022060 [Trypanosoma theileri]ORC92880.1 hypothetical protein TM35_000022060 [Trypanosoma theileri]